MSRTVLPLLLALLAAGCGTDPGMGPDVTPPGPITSLAAAVADGIVRLTWAEPRDEGTVSSLLVRFPGGGVGAAPTQGRTYQPGDSVGSGRVVHAGPAAAVSDAPGFCSEHVYAAWARDGAGNWSQQPMSVRVSDLLSPPVPQGPPSALSATIDGAGVRLAWTRAQVGNDAWVRVVRSSAPVSGPEQGQAAYFGSASSATDDLSKLFPLGTWRYTAFSCNPCGSCSSGSSTASVTPTLIQSLGAGGYVIFWRHGIADVCTDRTDLGTAATTTVQGWWRSCDRGCPASGTISATARQLSEEGRVAAVATGDALRARRIPFGQVFSSEFCRCTETAAAMALGPVTQLRQGLTFFVYDEPMRCAASQAFLAQVPLPGTNTALIAHGGFTCPVLGDLAMGEAAIFRPDGAGGYSLIRRVGAYDWGGLP
jgi:hypothetical protein